MLNISIHTHTKPLTKNNEHKKKAVKKKRKRTLRTTLCIGWMTGDHVLCELNRIGDEKDIGAHIKIRRTSFFGGEKYIIYACVPFEIMAYLSQRNKDRYFQSIWWKDCDISRKCVLHYEQKKKESSYTHPTQTHQSEENESIIVVACTQHVCLHSKYIWTQQMIMFAVTTQ